jgi:hypothetical protein
MPVPALLMPVVHGTLHVLARLNNCRQQFVMRRSMAVDPIRNTAYVPHLA